MDENRDVTKLRISFTVHYFISVSQQQSFALVYFARFKRREACTSITMRVLVNIYMYV